MSNIWEPWTPQIGQRVRVRLSAECLSSGVVTHAPVDNAALRALIESGGDANQWGVESEETGHPPEIDGVEGTVLAIDRAIDDGHYYRVWFDAPVRPSECWGLDMAAIELEPVQ